MTAPMTEIEYLNHAEAALAAIELNCDVLNDTTDADIDNQRTGGMITLTFKNKSQIIINLQKPLQEIWLAAKAGGFHYKFVGSVWLDTKQATELFADISRYASEQSGKTVLFSS
jgi:CyaY protein